MIYGMFFICIEIPCSQSMFGCSGSTLSSTAGLRTPLASRMHSYPSTCFRNTMSVTSRSEFSVIKCICTHLLVFQYTFGVSGPYTEWEYIGKISASIPCQRKVKDHVERDINHFQRGKNHTAPDKEEDVSRLQSSYHQSKIHIKKNGRKLDKRDKVADCLAVGSEGTRLKKTMDRWVQNRISEWSSENDWNEY